MNDALPERIGKYPVIRALGRGSTSRVYLAVDPFSGRNVAIKVIQRDPTANAELRRRFHSLFLNEAALTGKLKHPHIVAILDAVSDADQSYLVRGKPKSTEELPGSGQRAVTTLARV